MFEWITSLDFAILIYIRDGVATILTGKWASKNQSNLLDLHSSETSILVKAIVVKRSSSICQSKFLK